MKDAPLRHRLEYAAYRAVRLPMRLLPHAVARRLGRGLGAVGWVLDRRHRRIALDNLALALPELPAGERRRVARACFHHFGAALTDTLSVTRFDLVELCRRTTIEGWHHVQAAQAAAAPRGFFVATAHFGLWEVAAHALGIYAGPTWVVGRPLDNPHLDRELTRVRSRFGNRLLPKRGALRGILRAIEAGEVVALLTDQRVQPREAIDVPFFGVPAWTTPILARLSLRLQVPVVPGFGYPEPGGRYRFVVHPPVLPPVVEESDEAVAALTLRYHRVMEDVIRRDPELWLWLHRRWKR
ncbi:MAG TPA: lysophospholipid acyltransferase family protein [Thermoanaerobaculia bacterium]|nr:lysophospholipid acyltransferase family protein [Thermoanaerobaculia bacterium]